MLDLFVPCFSDEGSNKRAVEEAIMHNFCTLLEKCEDGAAPFTCGDILIFVTGASAIPPLGLIPTPTITFTSEERLLTASTCSNELRIPYSLQEYAKFEEIFDLSIRGGQGFGNI